MTAPRLDDRRAAALDAYLSERVAQGFQVETRTRTQAIIGRRRRTLFFLWWLGRVGSERNVISVDQHGAVTSIPAEPVRR